MKTWQASTFGSDSCTSRGKGKATLTEDSLNSVHDNHFRASSFPKSSGDSWNLKTKPHWSADDLSFLDETLSSKPSYSGASSSSSNLKSSRTSCAPPSNSSSSRSRCRNRRWKRSVSCVRTVFSDEVLGYCTEDLNTTSHLNSTGLERVENDATSASEDYFSSSLERLSALPLLPLTRTFRDYDRYQTDRNKAFCGEGIYLFEKRRKLTWRKLRHRRLLTNLFNVKPQSCSAFPTEPESVLVNIHVLGSPGPIRLVVGKNELVQQVIELSLQAYDCQKRQPPLGLSHRPFILYCRTPEFEAMDKKTWVGDYGSRHCYLYPKSERDSEEELDTTPRESIRGPTNKPFLFRTWFENSVAEVQSWGACLMNTLSKNIGCLASSLYRLNFDGIMCAVLKAFR